MKDFTGRYKQLKDEVDKRLISVIDRTHPVSLYEPAQYILEGGGKRIRPILVLLSCEAVGGKLEDAYDASVAIEILHNFTLIHDDIMDNAAHRRGRPSVHVKWDANTAILVGDELIGIAYNTLLLTEHGDLKKIIRVFTDGMIEVCEGQSYDKEFEARDSVSAEEYLMMIGKKTGRLVTVSAEAGALIGNASDVHMQSLLKYAEHIGRAFQIQDDLLDVFADAEKFGKPIGGDIIEGKKTFLLVEALQRAVGDDLDLLKKVAQKKYVHENIVEQLRSLYDRLGIMNIARNRIRHDTDAALHELNFLPPSAAREMLAWFAEMLLRRSF